MNDVVGNGAPSCGLPTPPTLSPFDVVRERTSWAELAARCGNPFATPEWLGAWRRYLCTDGDFVDCAMRDIHGTPRAVLPLERIRRGPLWIVRFQGCGPTDQVPPVCGPDDRAAVAEALRGAMARGELRADLLVAHGLPADEGWGVALGAARLRLEASPRIALPTTWQEFLAAKSRNFRGQLGARERRLRRTFDVRFRLADNGERLADDMSTLIRLHDLRWRGASGSFAGAREAFHRAFAAIALDHGWLRLWLLELDGRPAAAWYGLRFGRTEWFLQGGRDPALGNLSVGLVLMAHTVRVAIADGVEEYRLLRGDEPYKARFATDDPGLETIAAAVSWCHVAAVRAYGALLAAPDPVKMRVLAGRSALQCASRIVRRPKL